MNGKIKSIITNFSYTLTSQLVSTIISTLIILVVPKLIGVTEYGYWQLYLFYTAYLGFFNIGWVEGIYLRYGGKEYQSLDKKLFSAQFRLFLFYVLVTGSLISLYSFNYVTDNNKQFIFVMVSICLVLHVPRGFLLYILQSTNRIKEYSKLVLLDRIIYAFIIILMLFIGIRRYNILIIADLFGKVVTFIGAVYICRDIVFTTMVQFKQNLKETLLNISVGIKLLFANIASMLILGVIRFEIEHTWDIATFGKVSLTLSVSYLIMLFVDAVGVIIFPILRRTDTNKLGTIYITMRDFLMLVLFGALIIYYPLKYLLTAWLPMYADSLKYMALLFPMCIYEGKMSLLINTYLKTLRKEKLMLKINMISLLLCIIVTIIDTKIIKNLNLTIVSIVILLSFRCILAETLLCRIQKIPILKEVIFELVITFGFIFAGWFISPLYGMLIYGGIYIIYLLLKRKDVVLSFKRIKALI